MAEPQSAWSPLQRRVLAAMGMPLLRLQAATAVAPSVGVGGDARPATAGGSMALSCAGEVVLLDCAADFDASSKLGRALLRAAGLGIARPADPAQAATLVGPRLADPGRGADARRALWRQLRGLRRRLGADATP